MPSSMIFVGLVALWLLILVPAVARHRQEVVRPSVAALSGRVLERPQRRQNLEVDVMDTERTRERTIGAVEMSRSVVTRTGRAEPPVPAARSADAQVASARAGSVATEDRVGADVLEDETDQPYEEYDEQDGHVEEPGDDRRWERPPPRYRPGRGGYDPEVAALAARARYGFRQRVVLALLVVAVVSAVVAAVAIPGMWWVHAAADLALVGYLVYLRRQVRMEESIRDRRSARMAGTRRPAAEGPEPDELARHDRGVARVEEEAAQDVDEPLVDEENELVREAPERVTGTGASLSMATELKDPVEENALPRLQPAPPPALPAGTALVEADDDDPDLHDLDGPARPDYRRAVG